MPESSLPAGLDSIFCRAEPWRNEQVRGAMPCQELSLILGSERMLHFSMTLKKGYEDERMSFHLS